MMYEGYINKHWLLRILQEIPRAYACRCIYNNHGYTYSSQDTPANNE